MYIWVNDILNTHTYNHQLIGNAWNLTTLNRKKKPSWNLLLILFFLHTIYKVTSPTTNFKKVLSCCVHVTIAETFINITVILFEYCSLLVGPLEACFVSELLWFRCRQISAFRSTVTKCLSNYVSHFDKSNTKTTAFKMYT